MGVDAGDYDGSGWQSLVIGNFTNESMSLYRNDGSGLFVDEEISSGIHQMSLQALTFGCFFFDYDLDGRLDIFAANGHVSDDISVVQPTLKYAQPPILFHNSGNRKFEDASAKVGPAMQQPIVGRGVAYLDYDNDGDLDLVITANNGPARLLRNNNGNQNDMLRVKLVGTFESRRNWREGHADDKFGRAVVSHGEDRVELRIAERVAVDIRFGKAGGEPDRQY